MNEVAAWWMLSLLLCALCALLVWPPRGESFFETGNGAALLRSIFRGEVVRGEIAGKMLAVAATPLGLAALALAASVWLSEQSIQIWLETLARYAPAVAVALSLQALCLLLHSRLIGAWLTLPLAALSLQLWLYYQALGIEFSLLGRFYAAALLLLVAAAIKVMRRIQPVPRLIPARFCALLLLVLQWLFTAGETVRVDPIGLAWLAESRIHLAPLLLVALVAAGAAWRMFGHRTMKTRM